jgi:predicted nucleotidyltransferase
MPAETLLLRTALVIKGLMELKGVTAVLCFGSYALGTFDEYSDIDLYTLCQPEIPSPENRRMVCEKIAGMQGLEIGVVEPGWGQEWNPQNDRFSLAGLQFDLTYNTLSWLQTVVSKVKDTGATSIPELKFRAHTMLGLLENSVVLYDPEAALQKIIASLQPYPESLRQALLSENLEGLHSSITELQNYAQRSIGNTAFHFHLFRGIDALGAIMFALNRRYDPATKRVEEVFRSLPITPPDFLNRYNAILETPLTLTGRREIVTALECLAGDIAGLVQQSDHTNR